MVVFLQGCSMRCAYCHNPDTWAMQGGRVMDVDEIIQCYRRNAFYYRDGGITLSGGEPLLQDRFVLQMAKRCQQEGIHLTIDTCGTTYREINQRIMDQIIDLTPLFLVDIKYPFESGYLRLTGQPLKPTLDMIETIERKGKTMWIRYVVVPTITDDDAAIAALAKIIAPLHHIEKIEFLPYHTMALTKYHQLGIPYRLEGVPQATHEHIDSVKSLFVHALSTIRQGQG